MHYQHLEDESLVMLTLAGEQDAYEVLVVRYQRAAIASAAAITHRQFMAEDAAQDAFVTAWMKLNTLQEPSKFGAWVCRIATNCARNMVTRYHSFLPLDTLENLNLAQEQNENPAELYARREESDELHGSMEALPEKVRQIIQLHYFEGLSIVEIADRMRISVGTVKWQLHDGRKRIRKELCAMNEKWNDTLVQRVMKKVEELKLWQLQNDKSGFEVIYRDVLREVEELPESGDKYRALADVLMRGWWWLPGTKNDALFARIKEAAIKGKNDDVMEFIVTREDSQVSYGARIDFIRNKQIPLLEEAGFIKTLAREWFWLGTEYFKQNKPEKGHEAYDKVQSLLSPAELYGALLPCARAMGEKWVAEWKDKESNRYLLGANAYEFRRIKGALRFWTSEGIGNGFLVSIDRQMNHVIRNACLCDGQLFAEGLSVGETHTGSDGTTLSYVSDRETVETPCGVFEDCALWVTKHPSAYGVSVYRTYFKNGVGIVKQEHSLDGITDVRLLKSYHIAGGDGLLPISVGNAWEYADLYAPDVMTTHLNFTVSYADDEKVLLSSAHDAERFRYDENSWFDMIQQIRNEYCTHGDVHKICDVTPAIERAEALAKTPMEIAWTKSACSVARRILATDPTFNPDCTATGHWNFFSKNAVQRKNGSVSIDHHFRWSFEWKNTGLMGHAEAPIFHNDIYGILQDATNCLWSDEWRVGASPLVEYMLWGSKAIRTQIVCEDGGTVTTKAGTFENCLKLSLDIGGMTDGHSYRGGKKVYTFAEGVGIVRTETEYCDGARVAVYELTSYVGVGDGYMPFADGMVRRYDALNLTDGFVGASEYTYVADGDGEIVIFSDRTGIREIPVPITQYSAIQGEIIEDQLWDAGKVKEAHLQYAINNFHLMLHAIARPSRNRNNAKRTVELTKFNRHLIESFGDDGVVPPAWQGLYAWICLVQAAAYFGHGEKENGYKSLEDSLGCLERWYVIPDGETLEVGNKELFGKVQFIKGKDLILLPDGKKEPISYDYRLNPSVSLAHYALTAKHGWEWFNSIKSEDRYQALVERARTMMEIKA